MKTSNASSCLGKLWRVVERAARHCWPNIPSAPQSVREVWIVKQDRRRNASDSPVANALHLQTIRFRDGRWPAKCLDSCSCITHRVKCNPFHGV